MKIDVSFYVGLLCNNNNKDAHIADMYAFLISSFIRFNFIHNWLSRFSMIYVDDIRYDTVKFNIEGLLSEYININLSRIIKRFRI